MCAQFWKSLIYFEDITYLDGGFRCLGGVTSIAGILIEVSLWLRRLLDEDFLEAPSEHSGFIGWSWSWSFDNAVLDGESGFSELALDFFFDFSIFSSLFQLFQTVKKYNTKMTHCDKQHFSKKTSVIKIKVHLKTYMASIFFTYLSHPKRVIWDDFNGINLTVSFLPKK